MTSKYLLTFVFLWFPVLTRGFNQQLGHSSQQRLLPCHAKFSPSDKLKDGERKVTWPMYSKQLALFLTPGCYKKVEREKASLDMSLVNRRASILNPEMNPVALNIIWPVFPYDLDVKSIRADRITLSWRSWFFNKHPVNIHVEGLEITLGDQASGSVPVLEADRIQREWLEICGVPTELNEYQVGDGCKMRLLNTKATISSKRLPGGDIKVKIPVTDVVSVDKDMRERDLDECWEMNEGREHTACIIKRVSTEGLQVRFESHLDAHGPSHLRAIRNQRATDNGRLINSEGLALTWTLEKRISDQELTSQSVVMNPPRGTLKISVPPIFFSDDDAETELVMTLSEPEGEDKFQKKRDRGSVGRQQTTRADYLTNESTSKSQQSQSSENHLSIWGKTVGWMGETSATLLGSFKAPEGVDQIKEEKLKPHLEQPIHIQFSRDESTSTKLPPLRKRSNPILADIKSGGLSQSPSASATNHTAMRRRGVFAFTRRLNQSSLVQGKPRLRLGGWMTSSKSRVSKPLLKSLGVVGDSFAYLRLILRVGRVDGKQEVQ